jgi:hypothetical protein
MNVTGLNVSNLDTIVEALPLPATITNAAPRHGRRAANPGNEVLASNINAANPIINTPKVAANSLSN